MKSEGEEEAAGLNQRYATFYRPLSTVSILDSQLVKAEGEVMDVELHGARLCRDGVLECRRSVMYCTLDMSSTVAG